ncbi:MAG: bifunctional hydroxymethylpyrimidine kinase/phosphomethylpyrimidine kinase [Methanospirillum sp.]|nr:bifunctional hydroxymethylpyrimidine kinase/phosphomethylpyrimidine kinase [Methanospirillum sp.]
MTGSVFSALSIAGSDPSGGAGIQVDLKTFARTGVWGMAVITALTAQNVSRVSGSWPVDPGIVREQIETLLEEMTPQAIKTGMLANREIIRVVALMLPEKVPLVIDPVMVSTSGYRLLDESAIEMLCSELIPHAALVTPNIPEAMILSGCTEIADEEQMADAGYRILDMGAKQVVVKGGHGTGADASDILVTKQGVTRFSSSRILYEVHGSGCSYSAAITGWLARGYTVHKSCECAKELVNQGIQNAIAGRSGRRMINP